MDNGLMVLRRVEGLSPETLEEVAIKEADFPYFPDYLDNDMARDGAYTEEIMAHTLGFGVAREDGVVLKKFKTLEEAERARQTATVTFDVKVDIDGEETGE